MRSSIVGYEAIDCVGIQPVVEPDLGLCDNLKPNRFFGTERKRFYGTLLTQGPLFLPKVAIQKWTFYNNQHYYGKN